MERSQFVTMSLKKDGWGVLRECGMVFLNGSIIAVHSSGSMLAMVQKAVDVKEALWLLNNHPEARAYNVNRHFRRGV